MAFRFNGTASYATGHHASCCWVASPGRAPRRPARRLPSRNLRQRRRRLHRARKAGTTRRPRRPTPLPANNIACRRISTTKQTLALPGRTLAFAATAGSIRLFDEKGEPQADIAYTSYTLDGADPRDPAGHVPVQWRARRVVGLAAVRRCRPVGGCRYQATARSLRLRADLVPNAETWLDSLIWFSSIPSPVPGYSRFVTSGEDGAQAFFSVAWAHVNSTRSLVIRRWLEKYDRLPSPKFVTGESLWRHPRPENRPQPADPARRRRARADPRLASARLPRIFRLQPAANTSTGFPPWPRWRVKRKAR